MEEIMAPVDTSSLSAEERQKVIAALENDRYVWRTIPGIMKDTGLPEEVVKSALWDDAVNAIASSYRDDKDRELFTTRRHYQKKRSLGWRVLGAIAGKMA
jgi:hypothetical protein